ncbi:hypothetical protein KKC32_02110 [Patescibacteria group bacterium]|nr:hypothetical protein [Patescibacteria group bacterium]
MTEQIKAETKNLESMAVNANLSNVEREYFDKLKAELKQILGGKTLEDIEKTQDLVLARRVAKKMAEILEFLKTKEVETERLIIKDAKNPFAEAFKDGGVDAPETIDYELNFEELADMNAEVYESRGVHEWAEEVKRAGEKLRKMSLEKLEFIKQETREGAIAVIMPGKKIQLGSEIEQIRNLSPKYTHEYSEELPEASIDFIPNVSVIMSAAQNSAGDIPEGPYILLTKPTQDSEFQEMSVRNQIRAVENVNQKRAISNRPSLNIMNFYEYGAMQMLFSEMLIKRYEEDDVKLTQLVPLDKDTYTRFIPERDISCRPVEGSWNGVDRVMLFSEDSSMDFPVPGSGIRHALRILI